MTKNKKVLYSFIVGLLIGGASLITYNLINREKIPDSSIKQINIGYSPLIINLPIMIAKENDFFQQLESLRKVKINFIPVSSTSQLRDGVTTGKFDLACSLGTEMFLQNNILEKGNLQALYFNVMSKERYIDAFIAKGNSKISATAELNQLKVGCYPSPTIHKFLELFTKETGIKFTLIDVMPQQEFTALENGSVDAFFALEPLIAIAKKRGFKIIEIAPVENKVIQDEFPVGVCCVNGKFYSQNKNIVEDLQTSINHAIDFIEKNKSTAISTGEKFLKITPNTFSEVSLPKWKTGCEYKSAAFDKVEAFYFSNSLITELIKQQSFIICNGN